MNTIEKWALIQVFGALNEANNLISDAICFDPPKVPPMENITKAALLVNQQCSRLRSFIYEHELTTTNCPT